MAGRVKKPIPIAIAILAAYWVALFVLTHIPIKIRVPVTNWDKAAHVVAYAGLSFLLACVLSRPDRSAIRLCVAVLAMALFYGAADELIQALIPGRTADWKDWLADVLGAVIGLVVFRVFTSRRRSVTLAKAKASS